MSVVVLIIIAGVGYGLYFMKAGSTTTITTSAITSGTTTATMASNYQTVTGLAFSHWTQIGIANLSGTISQYSSNAALWWYVHDSALNTTSGPYTGSQISSTWTKFFAAGPTYWTVYNYSLTFPSSTSAKITADVWYIIGHGNTTHTLYLPYELDYNFQSGQWYLTADWWGLPHSSGVIYSGVVSPSLSAVTTTSPTTSSSATSTSATSANSTTSTTTTSTYVYSY
ncbi:MAG: hypothetical protein M1368_08360 [Thaumarchaeota archaeon]|nr:hypothetical protein [Nitrososphaerota archaeon]